MDCKSHLAPVATSGQLRPGKLSGALAETNFAECFLPIEWNPVPSLYEEMGILSKPTGYKRRMNQLHCRNGVFDSRPRHPALTEYCLFPRVRKRSTQVCPPFSTGHLKNVRSRIENGDRSPRRRDVTDDHVRSVSDRLRKADSRPPPDRGDPGRTC